MQSLIDEMDSSAVSSSSSSSIWCSINSFYSHFVVSVEQLVSVCVRVCVCPSIWTTLLNNMVFNLNINIINIAHLDHIEVRLLGQGF